MCAVGEPGYMKDDDDDIFAVEVDGEPGSMKDDDDDIFAVEVDGEPGSMKETKSEQMDAHKRERER